MDNHDDVVRELIDQGAAIGVENAAGLGEALVVMLGDAPGVQRSAEAGLAYIAGGHDVLDNIIREISPYILGRTWDEEPAEDRTA